MAIIINIDVMLAKRKMSVTELSERVGITMANMTEEEYQRILEEREVEKEAALKALEA